MGTILTGLVAGAIIYGFVAGLIGGFKATNRMLDKKGK